MFKGISDRTDGYKIYGLLLSGAGGYWIAKKKDMSRYDMVMLVLLMSSFGALLPDMIDGIRNENKPRIRQLTGEDGADMIQFGKDAWIPILAVGVIIFFFLKKDNLSKKQLLFLVFFVIVFIFMLNQTITFRKHDEASAQKDKSIAPVGETLLDTELILVGALVGMFLAHSRSNKSLKSYIFYTALGAGVGYAKSNIIKGNLNIDSFVGTHGKERHLREKRLHSRVLLLAIGKSITSKGKEEDLGTRLDTFVDGLNEKELIVMDRIYELEKDNIENGKSIEYGKIADKLRDKNFDQKDIDTFLQTTNSFVKFLTGQFIPLDSFGDDKEFHVNNTISEYELDKNGYLKDTNKKYRNGDTIRGKERWVWVNTKINEQVIRKQLRMVQLGDSRYILYVGVEKL